MKHTLTLLFLLVMSCLVIFAGCSKAPENEVDYSFLQKYLTGLYEDETAYTVKSLDGEDMTQQFLDDTRTDAEQGDWKKIDAYCRENVSLITYLLPPEETTSEKGNVKTETLRCLAVVRGENAKKESLNRMFGFDFVASITYDPQSKVILDVDKGTFDNIYQDRPDIQTKSCGAIDNLSLDQCSVTLTGTYLTTVQEHYDAPIDLDPIICHLTMKA